MQPTKGLYNAGCGTLRMKNTKHPASLGYRAIETNCSILEQSAMVTKKHAVIDSNESHTVERINIIAVTNISHFSMDQRAFTLSSLLN